MRLLLVDDNPADRKLVVRLLEREFAGLEPIEAGDAGEFERALNLGGFELAITDYRLRWTDGIAVFRALRARYPHLPVVMFTGSGGEELAASAIKAGLDDYVIKSAGYPARLPSAVAAALERARERRRTADLESLVNRLNIGVYRLRSDGRLLDANPAFLRLVGVESLERANAAHIGATLGSPPRGDGATRDGGGRAREIELRRPDGGTAWVLLNETVTTVGGEGVVDGFMEDITGRRSDEAARHRLAAIVESSDDAIIGKTLDGIISSWNAGAERIFGYTAEEAVGRHIGLLVPPGQSDEIPSILERIRRGDRIDHYETRRRRKDGVVIDISLSVSPIRDDSGRVIGASKIARDVTDRRRTEEQVSRLNQELKERVGELQTLLDILPVAVWIGDTTSDRIIGNRSACEMLGLLPGSNASASSPEVRAGRPRGFRYCRDGREIPLEDLPMRAAIRSGAAIKNFEQDIVFDDGRVVTIQGSAAPLFDDRGRVRGSVAACADITERKRAEEALKAADRRKDEFMAMLGHELRNPLGPIRNAVQILKLIGDGTAEAVEARAMIERQVAHMARLIDDLLDVSRIARGKIRLREEDCDLARIARETAADHRPALQAAGLELEVDLPAEPLRVRGDPTRLSQVIGNLLHNAQKFTDAGGRVLLRAAAEPVGDRAVVVVRDTGIGIEPEVFARMFDAFSQADTSLDRTRGGLGLGLSLVKGLVELHGGEVCANSGGPGRGAEFVVRLPLRRDDPPARPAAEPRAAVGEVARVLVVEDNVDAAESLRLLLKLSGHEVAVAHDGFAALEAVATFRPDLVLCDLGLPNGMSGYDVARALQQAPETAAIPLVALSGYGREEDRRHAREAGFHIHLTKPVDFARLREILAAPPRPGAGA